MLSQKSPLGKALNHLRAPIFSNSFFLILTNLIPMASGFLFWAMAARLMPADRVGWGSTLLSTSALIVSLSGLDLGTALIRFVPIHLSLSPHRVNTAIWTRVGLGMLAAIVFLIGVPIWSPALASLNSNFKNVIMFILGTIILSVSELLDHVFVAYRAAQFTLWKSFIISLGRFPALALLMFTFFDNGFDIYLSVVMPSAIALVIALYLYLPKSFSNYRLHWELSFSLLSEMAHYSLKNHLVTFLMQLPTLVMPILVLSVSNSADAGIVYLVNMMSWIALVIPTAVSRSLFAESSHINEHLPELVRKSLIFSFGLSVIPIIGLITLGPYVLQLLFGSLYAEKGAGLLIALTWSTLPASIVAIYVSIKRVKNQIGVLVALSITTNIIALGLGMELMLRWELTGLGWGLFAGQLFGALFAIREVIATLSNPLAPKVYL